MKNQTLIVRSAKAADVYKDIVRIDLKVRGEAFEESKIYKLQANGESRLVSIRGMSGETNRSPNDICMDEKTRRKFGLNVGDTKEFTLKKPILPLWPLICWSLGSSDPLQRMAAFWGIISGISLIIAIPGLFGLTLPAIACWLLEQIHACVCQQPH